ncbi:MAG: hypothetical protein K2Q20_02880, partial [Phycisphaerales bacterium]|nr:hypothetical protein [Phycisphaerales bacterium]
IYVGIDEAGYGPLLGPLCVGMAALRLDRWDAEGGGAAPDLWTTLGGAVCREASDKARRIAVNDSKALKLANSSAKKHPLTHLERGVLAFVLCRESEEACAELSECPSSDGEFLGLVGAECPPQAWYGEGPEAGAAGSVFPVGHTREQIAIARSVLGAELERAGVAVLEMNCRVIDEHAFNEIVERAGTKAATTELGLSEHLQTAWERWGAVGVSDGGAVRVVCDRQSGRADYTSLIQRALPGAEVRETHRSAEASRYEVRGDGAGGELRLMHVLFLTESEKQHLPVALASMLAKLTRETLMGRLNRHFAARMPELKPTAGYRQDGWRWIEEGVRGGAIGADERKALIRRA